MKSGLYGRPLSCVMNNLETQISVDFEACVSKGVRLKNIFTYYYSKMRNLLHYRLVPTCQSLHNSQSVSSKNLLQKRIFCKISVSSVPPW